MATKRILIADDHEVVRSGLRSILKTREDWDVVAEADNGEDATSLIVEKTPDVAIIAYSLPLLNGVEVTRNVRARQIETEILIFTSHDSDALVKQSFQAGARAFLSKSETEQELIAAVDALLAHKPYFTGIISEKVLANFVSAGAGPMVTLSPRERMVVQLVAEGFSNKEMSEALNLSVKTIETHRGSVMNKLSVKSVAGLVRYAIKNSLIEP